MSTSSTILCAPRCSTRCPLPLPVIASGTFIYLGYNCRMRTVHPEIEIKYDVDEAFELPSLPGLIGRSDGVTPIVEGEPVPQHLEATYFDTADLALARA